MRRADLLEETLEFSRVDGSLISPHLTLLRNGRIGGHTSPNEHRWELAGDHLIFFAVGGRATTSFESVGPVEGARPQDGKLILEGDFLPDPQVRHRLRAVAPPASLASVHDGIDAKRVSTGPRARNLVVLRANERSLHTTWPADLDDADRSWDLCVSWYGKGNPGILPQPLDYLAIQAADRKYTAIHKLFHAQSSLWDYDYIMFPDDDIMMSWSDINLAFETMRDNGLLLAQPSLSPEGHVLHHITGNNPETLLRFTSFVEVMTPIFHRDALRICAPTFELSASAFGLDHIWPKLLGEPRSSIGIIDTVQVIHTRPMGGGYDVEAAGDEGRRLQARYGAVESYRELGCIHRG